MNHSTRRTLEVLGLVAPRDQTREQRSADFLWTGLTLLVLFGIVLVTDVGFPTNVILAVMSELLSALVV
jgi:hypothetical protein